MIPMFIVETARCSCQALCWVSFECCVAASPAASLACGLQPFPCGRFRLSAERCRLLAERSRLSAERCRLLAGRCSLSVENCHLSVDFALCRWSERCCMVSCVLRQPAACDPAEYVRQYIAYNYNKVPNGKCVSLPSSGAWYHGR